MPFMSRSLGSPFFGTSRDYRFSRRPVDLILVSRTHIIGSKPRRGEGEQARIVGQQRTSCGWTGAIKVFERCWRTEGRQRAGWLPSLHPVTAVAPEVRGAVPVLVVQSYVAADQAEGGDESIQRRLAVAVPLAFEWRGGVAMRQSASPWRSCQARTPLARQTVSAKVGCNGYRGIFIGKILVRVTRIQNTSPPPGPRQRSRHRHANSTLPEKI